MRELFIRKLIKMVEQSDIESLEVSSWGRKVRIQKTRASANGDAPHAVAPTTHARPIEVAPAAPEPAAPPAPVIRTDLHDITSPMVGTFYRAPAPDAKPFVEVGDRVKVGQTICIVEAMKLMNEIVADIEGTVEAISIEGHARRPPGPDERAWELVADLEADFGRLFPDLAREGSVRARVDARLLRAAMNQADQGAAALPRYGTWANTVRDNIREALKQLDGTGVPDEAGAGLSALRAAPVCCGKCPPGRFPPCSIRPRRSVRQRSCRKQASGSARSP